MPNGEEDEPAGVGDRRGSGALEKSSKSVRDRTVYQIDASLRTRLIGWYRCIRFGRAKSFSDLAGPGGGANLRARGASVNGHATVNIEDVAGDKRSCV
jgi:hypothetical protein